MKLIFIFGIVLSTFFNSQNIDSLYVQTKKIFEQQNAPGAVLIWVQGDSTLIFETYGLANIKENRSIDPDKTIFRVGSISKPFTSIGVLNGVERGLLDLDKDINIYFDEPLIKDSYKTPLTLRHLLTHTGGLDDHFIGKSSRTRAQALTLEESVQQLLPPRVIESGEIASYSNFGAALAGYLLEVTDGRDFSDIIYDEVFKKTGMENSSFDPGEEALSHFMTGYFAGENGLIPLKYDYIHDSPAGMMVTTARDMERFMHLILTPGGLETSNVLSRDMTSEMMSVQFKHHPKTEGGFGFLWNIFDYNGHRVIGHDGGYIGASARLFIFPEHNAALFAATNMMDFGFIPGVTDFLIDNLLPENNPVEDYTGPADRYTGNPPFSEYTGTWRHTRYTKGSFTKFAVLAGIMGHEMITKTVGDSLLVMPKPGGESRRLMRVEPNLFQSIDDSYYLAFRENNGKVTHVFTNGTTALEKLHPLETRSVQLFLVTGSYLIFVMIGIGYPIIFLYRKFRKRDKGTTLLSRNELYIALAYCSSLVIFVILGAAVPAHEMAIGFGYGVPLHVYITTLLPYLALFFTLLLGIHIVRTKESLLRKSGSLFIVTVSVVLFCCLWYWNQVGWKF